MSFATQDSSPVPVLSVFFGTDSPFIVHRTQYFSTHIDVYTQKENWI